MPHPRMLGLLRAACLGVAASAASVLGGADALAQQGAATPSPTMNAIRQRGALICGVDTGVPGFATQDNQGRWVGLDISYCRAIAAAVLGDADKVRYVPTTAAARFTVLQSGEIDVLIRDSTLTFIRDVQLRLMPVAVNFYAGQGFLVRKALNVSSARDLDGATMCVITGATLELNIADFARSTGKTIGTSSSTTTRTRTAPRSASIRCARSAGTCLRAVRRVGRWRGWPIHWSPSRTARSTRPGSPSTICAPTRRD